jgi:hypothetical protein
MRTVLIFGLCAVLTGCATAPLLPDEQSDDGLVLQPTSLLDELFIAPGVSLASYRRVLIDPIEVNFRPGWREQHEDLSDKEIEALRARFAAMLRDKLVRELARGGYVLAESPDIDVLRLRPSLENVNLASPESSVEKRTFTRSAGEMTLRILGFDGPSGALVARARDYEQDPDTRELERTDRVTTNQAALRMFDKWAEALRSALDVAKVSAGARKLPE